MNGTAHAARRSAAALWPIAKKASAGLIASWLLAGVAFGGGVAAAQDIAGNWAGQYIYEDGRRRVDFKASITSADTKFWGRMTEPRTFGAVSTDVLTANIFGEVVGNRVTFTKNYDGTGNVRHSVNYTGALDASGRKIDGVWSIDKSMGRFTMTRVD